MDIIYASILGIIEGVTEFLPISSTGHLIVTSHLLGLLQSDFLKSFEIVIQLGAILAVILLYWKKLWKKETLMLLAVGFAPTAVIGFLFYPLVKHYLLGNALVVIITMIVGGVALITFETLYAFKVGSVPEVDTPISYKHAALLGLFQSIALVPGVSRSAATIVGGLSLGLPRRVIVEFSFLLAIPTMMAATGLDLLKSGSSFSFEQYEMLAIGFVVAFLTALLTIKALLRFIRQHTFTAFGVYRIIAGIVFALLIL